MTDGHTMRWRGWVAVAAAVLVLAILWTLHVALAGQVAGLFHDEGEYLVAARALARGLGYRMTSLPGSPPEVHYPPLFPLLLAGVWRLAPEFPANLTLLKGVPLAAAVGLVVLLPRYLVRIGVAPLAAGLTAVLTALAPLTIRYATAVVSELPFMLLLMATLLAVERAAEPGRPPGAAAWAGVLAGMATLTRLVGVAVIAAGALMLLHRTGRRRALAFGLAAALVLVPWLTWLAAQPDAGLAPGYLSELQQGGLPGPGELLTHLVELPAAVAMIAIPGLGDVVPAGAPVALILVIYAVGVLALGLALRSRAGTVVALALGLAVAWPLFQPRYVVPLAPLLLAPLLGAVLPTTAGPARRRAGGALGVALVGLALAGQQSTLASVRASGLPALEQLPEAPITWDDLDVTLAWLRASTAPTDVLGSAHDPFVALYTGRRAVRTYPALRHPSPEQVTARLARGGVRYLVDLPAPARGGWADARHAWRVWLHDHHHTLTTVYDSPPAHIRVWRVDATTVAAAPRP